MEAAEWDRRYAEARQWSVEPNRTAAELTAGLHPGRALDVAAGEGRMALWLARGGWDVEAVDFSAVGLRRGQQDAPPGARVTWRVEDVLTADLGSAEFDLVLVLYLHLPRPQMVDVLARSAGAVRPGGYLLVLGHDSENLTRGIGGPQDPDVLYDPELLGGAVRGWGISRLERIDRGTDSGTAVDTLLFAHRP
ncbi:bifunctional 2-polyprenyl-6-hydroxyphenol methylase/3-demethylubiquinol 3-O-methyltransferase UbiG [Blastococcus sp. TF02A-30]|uniref:class I SAM-dependent methyltransferase n=1 Tax=Blastococcus sp. TF02A-30 TaxID=2250580 RepID=UPI000DE9EC77|nr:class I SAM-dependent methyltransferase [Blastococcus sp. TF02A-30]RBY91160.1 class I SAM-dependent methyltransferase [Blastococcus sp. TF02A-30]